MSRLWAARRAFETMDRSRLSRRALLARARPTHRTADCLTAISECVAQKRHEKQQRPQDCSGNTSFVPTHNLRMTGEQRRERPTKVALEFLRQVSVAEQISWNVTVEEMWLFVKAFSYDEAVLEEPPTDNRSHTEFDDVEMHELPKRRADSRGSR